MRETSLLTLGHAAAHSQRGVHSTTCRPGVLLPELENYGGTDIASRL